MASNSDPSSSTSSAESPSDVIHKGYLLKRGGKRYFKLWQKRYFKLHRNGTLDRFNVLPISDDSKPTKSFVVMDFMTPYNFSAMRKEILKIKCLESGNVVKCKLRAVKPGDYGVWYRHLQHVASEAPVDDPEWAETVNPPVEEGPSNSNVTRRNFKLVKVLGIGAYGTVFLGKLYGSDEYYAVKRLMKGIVVDQNQVEHTKTESRVLSHYKHPFLTSMAFAFQTKNEIFFAMDYCIGGDLRYHLEEAKKTNIGFNLARIRFYAAEIACALNHLHSNKIVYRDLKPENVLLDKEGHIKIADFGLCKENIDDENRTKTICGTRAYMAPEVVEGNDYGFAVDWWALGVLVFEMFYRREPFYHENDLKMCELIKSFIVFFPDVNRTTRDFLKRLLEKDPENRLGGTELKGHPFFEDIDWDDLPNRNLTPPFIPDVKNDEDTKYFDKDPISQPSFMFDLSDSYVALYPKYPKIHRKLHYLSLHEERKDSDVPKNNVRLSQPL